MKCWMVRDLSQPQDVLMLIYMETRKGMICGLSYLCHGGALDLYIRIVQLSGLDTSRTIMLSVLDQHPVMDRLFAKIETVSAVTILTAMACWPIISIPA